MTQTTNDQQVVHNNSECQQANANAIVAMPKEVNDREHRFEKHQNNAKENTINSTQNNTINNSNKNNNTDNNKPKLDIKGPKPRTPLNITGPNMPYKIIKKSKPFEYNGKKLFLAQIDTGKERKTVCFQMNTATSGYVSDVGTKIINLCDDEGLFNRIGYGVSWLGVKICKLFDDDYANLSPEMEELIIKQLAWGDDQSKWAW